MEKDDKDNCVIDLGKELSAQELKQFSRNAQRMNQSLSQHATYILFKYINGSALDEKPNEPKGNKSHEKQ